MRNLSVRQVLTIGCLACVGAIVLLSESSTADSASAWLRAIVREIHLTCLEPSTQWLVVLGLLIYFVFFLWLARERNRNEVWWGLGNPDLWLCGLVLAGLVNYGLVHRTGWHGMQLIGLLAGMVLALAARSWAWRTGHGPDPRLVVRRLKLIITVVVTLLVCITLWQPELGSTYKYRGEVRWSGAWRNPNTYGLLMAVALVLTIGLFAANLAVPSGRRLRRLFFFWWYRRSWGWYVRWGWSKATAAAHGSERLWVSSSLPSGVFACSVALRVHGMRGQGETWLGFV